MILSQVNWHSVFWGMALQFWFAVLIIKTDLGSMVVVWLADRLSEFLHYTDKGSRVLFGSAYTQHRFIFQVCGEQCPCPAGRGVTLVAPENVCS